MHVLCQSLLTIEINGVSPGSADAGQSPVEQLGLQIPPLWLLLYSTCNSNQDGLHCLRYTGENTPQVQCAACTYTHFNYTVFGVQYGAARMYALHVHVGGTVHSSSVYVNVIFAILNWGVWDVFECIPVEVLQLFYRLMTCFHHQPTLWSHTLILQPAICLQKLWLLSNGQWSMVNKYYIMHRCTMYIYMHALRAMSCKCPVHVDLYICMSNYTRLVCGSCLKLMRNSLS